MPVTITKTFLSLVQVAHRVAQGMTTIVAHLSPLLSCIMASAPVEAKREDRSSMLPITETELLPLSSALIRETV